MSRRSRPTDLDQEVAAVVEALTLRPETYHVVPLHDLLEHVERVDCWCGPTVSTDLGYARVLVHHSADGRERREPDYDPSFGSVRVH